MKIQKLTFFLILLTSIFSAPYAATTGSMTDGLAAYQQGNYTRALEIWGAAEQQAIKSNNKTTQAQALWRQAEALRALGQHLQAIDKLELAKAMAENNNQTKLLANILSSAGDSLAHAGNYANATQYLNQSISLARDNNLQDTLAVALNDLGNLYAYQGNYDEAIKAYQECGDIAAKNGNNLLRIKTLTNAARLQQQFGSRKQADDNLLTAISLRDSLKPSHSKTYALIGMGRLAWTFYNEQGKNRAWMKQAYTLLSEARQLAKKQGDLRAESFAAGYLGQLYSAQNRDEEAMVLTTRAIFAAEQADAPDSAYLWHWQAGRLYRKNGDIDAAIASYRLAVEFLQSIRHMLSTRTAYKDVLGPVFFELTDLLLQRPNALDDKEKIEEYLKEARQTMELLKAAELQDYFQDNCVTALQSRITGLDKLQSRTAVLYPILLEDRMEILLSLSDGMDRAVVNIRADELRAQINRFRKFLEKRTTRQYMVDARKLYDLLIRPMEPALKSHNIDTLVIIPDSALRTIPISALHDGKEFLVAKYALATTPGLTLTDPKPLERKDVEVLAGGLTEGVQGFPPLPNVNLELENIQKSYKSTVLKDTTYVVNKVENELSETHYNVVHVASHAQFSSDPSQTFLLAYDNKLTMDKLERLMSQTKFRDDPVELLTLSACQTAAGDERAALGLAGIAIKAGARSALATLWFINDQASSLLVSEFYQQLKDPNVSKAKALQQAQLKIMADKRYGHPGYWAPFLLIGNWL